VKKRAVPDDRPAFLEYVMGYADGCVTSKAVMPDIILSDRTQAYLDGYADAIAGLPSRYSKTRGEA
jgi:hypothetical protein